MIMEATLKQLILAKADKLPSCAHYSELLPLADRITGSREKSRMLYGLFTYRQWSELVNLESF